MIAVVQRVSEARVTVAGETVGDIGRGLAVLASVVRDDTPVDFQWMAQKLVGLRVFPVGEKHFDQSLLDLPDCGILLVSNFTVSADARQGRRPSLSAAAPPDVARGMFETFVESVRATGVTVATGQFGGDMVVTIVNEGPATFILNSKA